MRRVGELLGLLHSKTGYDDLQDDLQTEPALVVWSDPDPRTDAGLAQVDLGAARNQLQGRVEARGITGGE